MLGPVHTYPGIFKSATFSLWIQKFPRPRVARVSEFAAEFAAMCVDGIRIREEKVADSKVSGYVLTAP